MKILSIDAWASVEEGVWDWNNWFHVGDLERSVLDLENDKIIQLMIDKGYLKEGVNDLVDIDDDQYNLVIFDNETGEPLLAIEYGAEA